MLISEQLSDKCEEEGRIVRERGIRRVAGETASVGVFNTQ